MSFRVGDHVRVLASNSWSKEAAAEARRHGAPAHLLRTVEEVPGPPVGTCGTVGMVVPKTHDDFWDAVVVVFDWGGRLAPPLPRGTWFAFDNGGDIELLMHCAAPAPCVCNGLDAPPSNVDSGR